jgi:drug/metabolite transporter (DMT)-like permease
LKPPSHLKAVLLALLVTFIWSTSWIFIKIGLAEIPAMTFAGLRYFLAFLVLLPFLFQKQIRNEVRSLTRRDWLQMALLGLVYYAVAQGGQFLALAYLPSVTVSLILNLCTLFVAFSALVFLNERPSWLQWLGISMNLVGMIIYFYPVGFTGGQWLGILFAVFSLGANIGGSILSRKVNREAKFSPLMITIVSMGIGSTLMLGTGLITQGIGPIRLQSWGIILLLAVVNTAFCFTVWNYVLQTLSATESSIVNSTMLVQIAILAWIFLGETHDLQEIIGLALTVIGVAVFQLRIATKKQPA